MPYNKEIDIPLDVRKRLSPSAQRLFLEVSRNAWRIHQKTKDERMSREEAATRAAWTAVKNDHRRIKGGLWVKENSR